VRENLLAVADLIKVYIMGTLRGPREVLHYYSREEIQVAVDEAHRMGVPVATHCIGGQGLKMALETGIDVIEHGYFVTDEEIESLLKYGRWLVITPSIFFTDARIRTLPPNLIDGHLRQREEVRVRLAAAIRAGSNTASAPMPCTEDWPGKSAMLSKWGRHQPRRFGPPRPTRPGYAVLKIVRALSRRENGPTASA
jgi:imidazolonepropionase-like amidohydrolase